MPIKRFDKTEQLAVGVGTAALTFTSATTGNRTYAAAGAEDGDQFWARIEHETLPSEWEICLATIVGGTIVRSTPIQSSTGAAVAFSAGNKIVSDGVPFARIPTADGDVEIEEIDVEGSDRVKVWQPDQQRWVDAPLSVLTAGAISSAQAALAAAESAEADAAAADASKIAAESAATSATADSGAAIAARDDILGLGLIYDTSRSETIWNILSRITRNYADSAQLNVGIRASDGAVVSVSSRFATGLLPVKAGMIIVRDGAGVTSNTYAPYAWYKADGTWIQSNFTTGANSIDIVDVGAAMPALAAFIRLGSSNPSGTVKYFIYDKKTLELLRDSIFSVEGIPIDISGSLTNQYINKSTGVIANSSAFRLTGDIAVTTDSYLCCMGGQISDTISLQAQMVFWDAGGTFLGHYNPKARGELVRVSDHFPTATKARVCQRVDAGVGAVYCTQSNPRGAFNSEMLASAAIVDWLSLTTEDWIKAGRVDSDGSITQPGHSYWRYTGKIPVVEGQIFYTKVTLATGAGPMLAMFDSTDVYLGDLNPMTTNTSVTDRRLQVPAGVAYLRQTFRADTDNYLLSARPAQLVQESANAANGVIHLAPTDIYGRVGEYVYAYAAGIVGDPAVELTFEPEPQKFNVFQGVRKLRFRVNAEPVAPPEITMSAVVGTGRVELGTMSAKLVDMATVVSPTKKWNVVCIGDSTTSQLSGDPNSIDGDGTWVNEMSRQLTGVGVSALTESPAFTNALATGSDWGPITAADIRSAGSLSNIFFRGTRGQAAVKHNGYGGWHPSNFLERNNQRKFRISAPFVSGNSFTGQITDGTTVRTVGPVAFTTDNATTLDAIAAALQAALRLYGEGANPPLATADGVDDIDVWPKWNISFVETAAGVWGTVTGGASQNQVQTTGDGKFNPFYDPDMAGYGPASEYRFSMSHFLETYAWRAADDADGVETDGNNLLVILLLGWNDYGDNTLPGTSAGHMAYIIDKIHEEYPQATVWVPSLWAPPQNILKQNTGSVARRYSPAVVFDESVRAYGEAYRNMVAARALGSHPGPTEFVQLSHQSDPDTAYSRTTQTIGRHANDASMALVGSGDFVHRRRIGYCDIADVMADKFLFDFCRP